MFPWSRGVYTPELIQARPGTEDISTGEKVVRR